MREPYMKSFPPGKFPAELLHRLMQPDPFQDRWMELAAQGVHFLRQFHQLSLLLIDALADVPKGAGKLLLEFRHIQYQAAQVLRYGIVQFACDALAFRFLTGQQGPLRKLESGGIADHDDAPRKASVGIPERACRDSGPNAFRNVRCADENLQPIHGFAP